MLRYPNSVITAHAEIRRSGSPSINVVVLPVIVGQVKSLHCIETFPILRIRESSHSRIPGIPRAEKVGVPGCEDVRKVRKVFKGSVNTHALVRLYLPFCGSIGPLACMRLRLIVVMPTTTQPGPVPSAV